jgi:hypothetical protein
MVGAYVFSQAKNADEARKEANYAITRLKALGIGPKNLDLPVYMDYEFAGGKNGRLYGLKKKNATAAAKAFCEVIRDAGYTPGIYASTLFYKNYIDTSVLGSDVDLWCAQYYKRCESGIAYSKWQYSSTARISGLLSYLGVKGNIDVNFWYLDTDQSITPKVTISGKKKYNYTGKRVVPSLTVKSGDKTLKEGTDYILGGISNINPGTAYAYVKGVGKYSGTAFVPFTIRPAKTSIVSLTGKKKAFQIKVKKLSKSKVTGYQVKYSRRSDMEESVVKTIGTKYSKVSKKIKVNARNQLYYVQVRTYKKINGKKYYSTWSDISTVTSK